MSGQADRTVDEVLRELSEKYGSLFSTESPARTKIPLEVLASALSGLPLVPLFFGGG